jgi:hypothetical protein
LEQTHTKYKRRNCIRGTEAAVDLRGVAAEVLVHRIMRATPVGKTPALLVDIFEVRCDNEAVVKAAGPAVPTICGPDNTQQPQ